MAPTALGPGTLVVLDGVESLRPDSRGRFRFECVAPGEHWVTLLAGPDVRELRVRATAADTTRILLPGDAGRP